MNVYERTRCGESYRWFKNGSLVMNLVFEKTLEDRFLATGDRSFRIADDHEVNDTASPEGHARKTIDNLREGVLSRRTVQDLGDAVKRASSDQAVGGIFGRRQSELSRADATRQ